MNARDLFKLWAINLFIKFLGFGCIFYAYDMFIRNAFTSLVLTSASGTLALIGSLADLIVVPRLKSAPSLLLGAPVMVIIILFYGQIFKSVAFSDAMYVTLCIGPFEYMLHRWVRRQIASCRNTAVR